MSSTQPTAYGESAAGGQGPAASEKSFIVTWILAWFLGVFGADRFYLGKVGTAILKLITLGGLGIWALIDLILVLTGVQRDKHGRKLQEYDRYKKLAWAITLGVWLLSVVVSLVTGTFTGS
ncbi:MAG: TM2 domain-containing protein [Ornithinimicrobium sp.]